MGTSKPVEPGTNSRLSEKGSGPRESGSRASLGVATSDTVDATPSLATSPNFKPDTALGWRHERLPPERWDDCPYLERWIFNFGPFALRLHHFFRSDEDHLHDHPFWFWTLVLRGHYCDVVQCQWCKGTGKSGVKVECGLCGGSGQVTGDYMSPGTLRYRPALHLHRVVTTGCWTFVISGKKARDWGFSTPRGWMRQRRYFREYGGSAACQDQIGDHL